MVTHFVYVTHNLPEIYAKKKQICNNHACQNRGICVALNTTNYGCYCVGKYTGSYCQHRKNGCTSNNPCKNKGTCVEINNTLLCICKEQFAGKLCEKQISEYNNRSVCENHVCQNGAKCIENGSKVIIVKTQKLCTNDSAKLSTTIVILIIAGIVLFICLFAGFVYIRNKRRNNVSLVLIQQFI